VVREKPDRQTPASTFHFHQSSKKVVLDPSLVGRLRKKSNPYTVELWQLGYHNGHERHEIDGEVGEVVVGIMRAEEKQYDGHRKQKLLRRCILIAVVDLLPHVQVVVCAGIKLEWHAPDPVKHQVGACHIRYVRQSPRYLLRDAGDDVEEDLQSEDNDRVYCPSAYK
jgi:hypothetical protein